MAIRNPAELAATLPPKRRLLGLDVGAKTIGLAVSDPSLRVATPVSTIRRGKRFRDDAAALAAMIAEREIGGLVIGLPVNMDGSEGPRCQATRAFVRNMVEKTPLPFVYWDERLSTVAAERVLIEMDVSRKKRAERIDSAAASFILQGALDRLASLARDGASGD